jgi:hypothetical protein
MIEESALTQPMADAIRRYGQAYEDAQSFQKATKRLNGQDRLKASRALLEPLEVAVLDMVGGRGFTVQDLAAKTGRSVESLTGLLVSGATKLLRP